MAISRLRSIFRIFRPGLANELIDARNSYEDSQAVKTSAIILHLCSNASTSLCLILSLPLSAPRLSPHRGNRSRFTGAALKSRFFVLEGTKLSYFTGCAQAMPKGVIDIEKAQSIRENPLTPGQQCGGVYYSLSTSIEVGPLAIIREGDRLDWHAAQSRGPTNAH